MPKSRLLIAVVVGLAAIIILAVLMPGRTGVRHVTIGTGSVTGVYYPAGGAIARLVNEQRGTTGIRMSVESTPGSVFNINAVLEGQMDFGIAQSDRQYQALNGLAAVSYTHLRAHET